MDALSLAVYAVPVAGITSYYLVRQRRTNSKHLKVLEETLAAGMTEPASLHPIIDPSKCLGCGACVKACPETSHHDVLGLINGKAALTTIVPTLCPEPTPFLFVPPVAKPAALDDAKTTAPRL